MSLSSMEVFNKYYMPATMEQLGQMIQKFNAASNGSLLLVASGFEGDFEQTSFYNSLANAQRRVDRYGPNNPVAPVDLTQDTHNAVKVAGGFGPVRFEPSQMTWLLKPTAEGVEMASRSFAEVMLQDMLNTTIATLVAAIGNQGALTTVDVSATKQIDFQTINQSHGLFGDHSAQIVAQIMNGYQYHAMIGANLNNANNLFQAGNVRVIDILGRPSVVTDSPALTTPAAGSEPAKTRVLSLVSAAARVHDNGDIISNVETKNGYERIETTVQMDYSFGIGLKGYSWDPASGGASPTNAELATGANWDRVDAIKNTAGVMAVGMA
ncbi:major capsid protein [Erwinia phage Gungnir39]|nr:major capsid protein [Erwinia phage Gungnir39]